MLNYSKLWLLLNDRGMKRTDLLKDPVKISSATLAKLGKNEHVSTASIEKICDFLECQPGDIMENVTENDISKFSSSMQDLINAMIEKTSIVTGEDAGSQLIESLSNDPQTKAIVKDGKIDIESALLAMFEDAKSKRAGK